MTIGILPQMLPWVEVPGGGATISNGALTATYDIRVRNSSLQLVGEVQDYAKCTIIKTFNNVGQCTLLLNYNDPMAPYLATPGYGIVITRTILNSSGVVVYQDPSFFSGSVWELQRDNKNGQKTLQVVAYDDLLTVALRDAWPYPQAVVAADFANAASDVSSGNAETVIQHYVNVNAGPGAPTARQTPNLVMGTNNNNGASVKGAATFDRMIARDGTGLLQRLALASAQAGSPIGYKVTQSGTTLTFSCYVPTDNSSNCVFSDDLGNLGDFTYSVKGPDWEAGGNALVVGGSGTGTARTYYMITDTGSISSWGRAEAFIDQGNTTDATALSNAAAAAIVALRSTSSLTLQLVPQAGLIYGVDFNLGDKVTYVIDGAALTDIVREVQIDLDPSTGEVVTPAVGSPNTASLMNAYAAYIQQTQAQIAAIRNRVANVERRAN